MSLDLNELQREAQRQQEQQGNGNYLENFVKMPEGNGVVVVRLLPPAPSGAFDRAKNPFYVASRIHKINGKNIHSPKTLNKATGKWEGDCPIHKYYNHLWEKSKVSSAAEAERLQAQARVIKPIERYYYNVIVRSETDKNGDVQKNVGPKILSVGKTLHQMIVRAIVGSEQLQEPALGDVTDPKTGRDFKIVKTIRKSGNEAYPNYSDSKFLEPSPLGDPDQVAKWIENLHDLEAIRMVKSVDELKIELKKHLGLIANETSSDGFDPSEFEVGSAQTDSVKVEETISSENQEVMVESDFLDELKNM